MKLVRGIVELHDFLLTYTYVGHVDEVRTLLP